MRYTNVQVVHSMAKTGNMVPPYCAMWPATNEVSDGSITCECGHVWVTFSEGGTVMVVGADERYDPVATWCEDEKTSILLPPHDGLTYVRLEEGWKKEKRG